MTFPASRHEGSKCTGLSLLRSQGRITIAEQKKGRVYVRGEEHATADDGKGEG